MCFSVDTDQHRAPQNPLQLFAPSVSTQHPLGTEAQPCAAASAATWNRSPTVCCSVSVSRTAQSLRHDDRTCHRCSNTRVCNDRRRCLLAHSIPVKGQQSAPQCPPHAHAQHVWPFPIASAALHSGPHHNVGGDLCATTHADIMNCSTVRSHAYNMSRASHPRELRSEMHLLHFQPLTNSSRSSTHSIIPTNDALLALA